jgi:RND family efflux transporter MFP subunit
VTKEKLRMLEEFSRVRKEAELTANADDAAREQERTQLSQAATLAKMESDYLSANDTADMERAEMERLKAELDRCTVRAPQDGILVYDKGRPWDASSRIQAGAIVHFQQTIFSLPDLTQMQVKAKIHESAVKKLKPGQQVEIRLDAYVDRLLHGEVEKVATLADSRGWWDQRSVKEYETIVKVRDLPASAGLKPGMTAEVTISVNHLLDVVIVPVQAVVEQDGEHYSYVVSDQGVDRKPVVVGEKNDKFVEIKSGLQEGEQVALDARARLATAVGKSQSNGTDRSPSGAQVASKPAPGSL